MATERTENPYSTYGPADTHESWGEYFRRILHDDGVDRPADDPTEHTEPELYHRVASGDDLEELDSGPVSHARLAKLLISNGFGVRDGWCTLFYEGGTYGEKAQKAFEKKPDRTIDYTWLEARRTGAMVRALYERVNGKSWTCIWRQINGLYKPVSDKELREFISGND